jgi:hypothetical protein
MACQRHRTGAQAALPPIPAAVLRDAPPGLARLTRAELRKTWDTRAGMSLLLAHAALFATAVIVVLVSPEPADARAGTMLKATLFTSRMLLPIVGILLIGGEWTHRTTLVTFALVPRRGRVLLAKTAAGVVLACAWTVASFAAMGLFVVTHPDQPWPSSLGLLFVQDVLYLCVAVVTGLAFGAAMLATTPALVCCLLLPTTWEIVLSHVPALSDVGGWLAPVATLRPLTDHPLDGGEWARALATLALWTLAPLAIGLYRVGRSELR